MRVLALVLTILGVVLVWTGINGKTLKEVFTLPPELTPGNYGGGSASGSAAAGSTRTW
jgi:hypothetical protein